MRLDTHTEWAGITGSPQDLEHSSRWYAAVNGLAGVSLLLFAIGLLLPAMEGVPGYVMLRFGVYHYGSNALLLAAPLLVRLLRHASPWAVGMFQLVMTVSTMWVAFGAMMFVAPVDLASGYVVWVAAHVLMTMYVFLITGVSAHAADPA
ncbi:MAG: hypothetical protein GC159_07940 [Phycisphaera sp.]|nr:hypothetical protein [Phycisphaera sp.]